jgi:iron complex transport system substrate-binding protein
MNQKRIVSLLPSCTEMVCALGCGGQIVGRSHECDFPPEIQGVPVCTAPRLNAAGTGAEIDAQVNALSGSGSSIFQIDAALLRRLQPDLVLTQTQCDVCAVSREELEKALPPSPAPRPEILSVAPARLADVWKDMQMIAAALDVAEEGKAVLWTLKNRVVDIIQKTCLLKHRPAVACLEWLDPLMAPGNWLPEMVDLAGGRNLFGEAGRPSRRLDWGSVERADPDALVLLPCGFDLARTRREAATLESRPGWARLRAVKSKNVFLTDGNSYFNRPGPRLVESMEILAEMLHPKLFSCGHEGRGWARRSG